MDLANTFSRYLLFLFVLVFVNIDDRLSVATSFNLVRRQ